MIQRVETDTDVPSEAAVALAFFREKRDVYKQFGVRPGESDHANRVGLCEARRAMADAFAEYVRIRCRNGGLISPLQLAQGEVGAQECDAWFLNAAFRALAGGSPAKEASTIEPREQFGRPVQELLSQ